MSTAACDIDFELIEGELVDACDEYDTAIMRANHDLIEVIKTAGQAFGWRCISWSGDCDAGLYNVDSVWITDAKGGEHSLPLEGQEWSDVSESKAYVDLGVPATLLEGLSDCVCTYVDTYGANGTLPFLASANKKEV